MGGTSDQAPDVVAAIVLDTYEHLDGLGSVRQDASALTAQLHRAGFAPLDAVLTGDRSIGEIRNWAAHWRPPRARKIIVYWAGHGKQLDDRTFVLLAEDTAPAFVDITTAFEMTQLGRV